jgi:hypothetical protein
VFCPTQREEKNLGYDAALQNAKLLIIQYKRIRLNKKNVAIEIDKEQHEYLVSTCPPFATDYVFYAFSEFRTYRDFNTAIQSGGDLEVLHGCVFVSAHEISGANRTINWSENGLREAIGHRSYSAPLSAMRGDVLLDSFFRCEVGHRIIDESYQDNFVSERIQLVKKPMPYLSVFVWTGVPNS